MPPQRQHRRSHTCGKPCGRLPETEDTSGVVPHNYKSRVGCRARTRNYEKVHAGLADGRAASHWLHDPLARRGAVCHLSTPMTACEKWLPVGPPILASVCQAILAIIRSISPSHIPCIPASTAIPMSLAIVLRIFGSTQNCLTTCLRKRARHTRQDSLWKWSNLGVQVNQFEALDSGVSLVFRSASWTRFANSSQQVNTSISNSSTRSPSSSTRASFW